MPNAFHTALRLLLTLWALHVSVSAAAESDHSAPVQLANRTIVVLRATMLGYSPSERAEGAETRLRKLVAKGGPGEVSAHRIEQGATIDIDGVSAFALTPGDIDEPAGETLESTIEQTVRALQIAIGEVKEREDGMRMGRALGLALLAAALYATLLIGLFKARLGLSAHLTRRFTSKVSLFKVAGVLSFNSTHFLTAIRVFVDLVCWFVALVGLNLWLTYTLDLFPYTRPWGEHMEGYLLDLLTTILQGIINALPGLFTVAIIVAITRFLARMLRAFFQRIRTQKIQIGWLDEETAQPTERIATFVLWLFALVMAFPYLPGSSTDAFKGLSVLLGIMVSIGASGVVGQVASGLILMYSRPLRMGDYVKLGDVEGTVTAIGLLTTRLHNGMGEEIVLPNVFVMSNVARNFSSCEVPGRRNAFAVQVSVTIGYSTPWRQVNALLLEAARTTPGLLQDPQPAVVQVALSDFYVEYRLFAYADTEDPSERIALTSTLNANVLDMFNLHGVQIMSPHYLGDPTQPQVVPPERWFEAPARKPGD